MGSVADHPCNLALPLTFPADSSRAHVTCGHTVKLALLCCLSPLLDVDSGRGSGPDSRPEVPGPLEAGQPWSGPQLAWSLLHCVTPPVSGLVESPQHPGAMKQGTEGPCCFSEAAGTGERFPGARSLRGRKPVSQEDPPWRAPPGQLQRSERPGAGRGR